MEIDDVRAGSRVSGSNKYQLLVEENGLRLEEYEGDVDIYSEALSSLIDWVVVCHKIDRSKLMCSRWR